MKTDNIPLQEIRQHPEYIRGQHSKSYVEELAEVLKTSGWVFPAVKLQPIPQTDKSYADGTRYWIIDGTHRVAAAIQTETKIIPAEILPPLNASEAIALQVKTNNAHGLRLSQTATTNAIKKMAELGVKGKEIAAATGLHPSSVSRILGDKQRKDNPTGKSGGESESHKRTPAKFNAENWMKGLSRTLKGWEKYGTKIRKAGFPENLGKHMDVLAEKLLHADE